jgi:cbb3-type cytochrome oxidase subunit 3
VLSLICMLLVFAAVVYITLRLNARLRREQRIEAEILNEEMATG